jgi:hypothetical protein
MLSASVAGLEEAGATTKVGPVVAVQQDAAIANTTAQVGQGLSSLGFVISTNDVGSVKTAVAATSTSTKAPVAATTSFTVSAGIGAEGEASRYPYATGVTWFDVNGDGYYSPQDVLIVIGTLNSISAGTGSYVFDPFVTAPNWPDTNGDGYLSPLDALGPITNLNVHGAGPVQGPNPHNLPPRGFDLSASTKEDRALAFVAPFIDPEQGPLTVAVTSMVNHGTLGFESGSTWVYTPSPGFVGAETFSMSATDSGGLTGSAQVTINVQFDPSLPHPPVAVPDSIQMFAQAGQVGIHPLDNDISYHGALRIVDFGQGQHGTVRYYDAGLPPDTPKFLYTPVSGFVGTDSFTYVVRDEAGQDATGTVTIDVTVNQPPVPSSPVFQGQKNQQIHFVHPDMLGTDPDGPGYAPFVNSIASPAHGGLYSQPRYDGTGIVDYWYTPNANFVGTDSTQYELWDLYGNRAVGTVTFVISEPHYLGPQVTRSEFAYAISQIFYVTSGPVTPTYQDVAGNWAAGDIGVFEVVGLAKLIAPADNFWPANTITIGEVAIVAQHMLSLPGGDHLTAAQNAGIITASEAAAPATRVGVHRFFQDLAEIQQVKSLGAIDPGTLDTLAAAIANHLGATY